jgi:hypothetical protein
MYMYGQSLSRRWKIGLKGNRFRIFDKIIFEFFHKGLGNIYKNNKNFGETHTFLQKWAILYFPWRVLYKRRKLSLISKQPGFLCKNFSWKRQYSRKFSRKPHFFTKTDYFRAKLKCLDNFRGNGNRLFCFKPNYILVVHYFGFYEE